MILQNYTQGDPSLSFGTTTRVANMGDGVARSATPSPSREHVLVIPKRSEESPLWQAKPRRLHPFSLSNRKLF